ncbi:peptidoglycan-binding protein [Patescibacteria group bacterium]|nr:peptidoglycan-binding protein [Patescibacteria group bacterium]
MNYLKLRKLATAKSVSVFVGFAMTLSLVGGAAMPAQAATVEELTAQIASLLATISSLQTQLSSMTGGTTTTGVSYTFTRNLKLGMTGDDVMNLQKVLNMSADTQVAASGIGSAGNESSYFGGLTKAAVIKFQNKYASEVLTPVGLTLGTGYVGASTRAKLNTMGETVVTPTTPGTVVVPAGTGLTVTAASQPAASLAPASTARVPFTRVTLTAGTDGDVAVNSVTVERTGLGSDNNFAGIVLLDEDGTQLGIAKTLNSNHQATVGEEFTVKAGTSKTITIAGNMAVTATMAANAGQVVSLSVVAVNTSAAVTGALPITGAAHTINGTLTVGSATPARGPLDPDVTADKEIGSTGHTFSSVRVTAGSAEKIRLHSIRWNQSGSASKDDLANITVYVDGTAYATTVSADGKYYTASFGSGIVVDKGLQKEISIKGDIVGGTNRTVAFDLYKNTDLYVTGETYGYGITPASTGSGFATTNPWYDAVGVVTITAGSVNSISKSNTVAAQNIAILAANQPLGGFEVEVRGEAISIQQMIFNIQATGDEAENITNISLVDQNGSVIAGPVDGASTSTNSPNGTVTFTDTVTFPTGKTVLTLKGQLGSTFVSNDTVAASTTPSSQWTTVTGQDTGDSISLSTFGLVTGNTMTVKAGALAISLSSQPTDRSVIAGAQGFEFARYILDAGQSGEDVRLTTLPLEHTLGTIVNANLSNCNLYDGDTNVTDDTNVTLAASGADTTFTFNDGGMVVPKGTQKSLSMRCDLAAGATSGTIQWGLSALSSYTAATAVGSGQTVAETATANAGQTMTAATSGSFTVTNDASLLYSTAQAGSTGVTLAKLRFTAGATEAVDLKQIALQLANTASNSPADLVGEKVMIYNGSTLIGTAQFGGANADNATSTQLSPAPRVEPGESVLLTIKADLSAHNVNEGTPGAFLSVSYDGDNNGINGNYATGADSQVTISGTSSDVTTNGLRIFRTVPTIAVTSNGGTLSAGANLYTFTVTNPNNRDVVFKKFSMSVATTGGNTNGFILYGDGVAFNSSVTLTTTGQVLELSALATSQAKVVPANSTKTYVLKASTAVDAASVSETINLALLADTSYPALAGLMGSVTNVDAGAADTDNIIWSPFSTTTPVATSDTENNQDWTNGYGLPGFPANAAFQTQTWTRSN